MNRHLLSSFIMTVLAVLAPSLVKAASGWPANYEGVMLQGFYWDSYSETSWKNLEAQSDELSKYFDLIWVPNSAKAEGSPSMGYHPIYWFTNHNSSFGTEKQLRSMISTFKAKGTGIIADVVINHRSGVSNWTNFPAESWNGKTYKIGTEGICKDDEVAAQAGQAKPTGANDTGEGWNGSRDLDHTNANVQENCKAYVKCLLEDFGYAGVRYDFVKGYAGRYTNMYNTANNVKFSVGEYWDGSYDAVKNWIESTGKTSAAFDFPCKYAINKAFDNNNMTELVWKANGTNNQPAGMIHFGYAQYAVTFIDNHDTYGDGSKFKSSKVVAANAFILCSPGTPCVFYPHWKAHKAEIQKLIAVRKAVGVHNMSAVNVLKSSNDCYMAEVTGTKGKLVVKIGSSMDSPAGYSASDIKASGTDYCVWSKVSGGVTPDPVPDPDPDPAGAFNVYFSNDKGWATPYIHYWGNTESNYPGEPMTKEGNVWKYTVPAGTTGILFNAGDGDKTKTADMVAVKNHLYSTSGDQGVYNGGNVGDDPQDCIYMLGEPAGGWKANVGKKISGTSGVFTYSGTLESIDTDEYVFFGFAKSLGATESDWETLNANRYGSKLNSELPEPDGNGNTVADYYAIDGGGSYPMDFPNATSWRILPGKYTLTVDTKAMTLKVEAITSGIESVEAEAAEPVYYNLQGVRVDKPAKGLYIRVQGRKASKVYIR